MTRRIDTVSRREGPISIEALDSALFPLPELVDYQARFDGALHIEARTVGGKGTEALLCGARNCCPNLEVAVQTAPARLADRPMYLGKRHIL